MLHPSFLGLHGLPVCLMAPHVAVTSTEIEVVHFTGRLCFLAVVGLWLTKNFIIILTRTWIKPLHQFQFGFEGGVELADGGPAAFYGRDLVRNRYPCDVLKM